MTETSSLVVVKRLVPLLFKQTRAHQHFSDHVRVTVGGRAAVLKVALPVLAH